LAYFGSVTVIALIFGFVYCPAYQFILVAGVLAGGCHHLILMTPVTEVRTMALPKIPEGKITSMTDFTIPNGLTCGDCFHYPRCEWLIQASADKTICDWEPSRFSAKVVHHTGADILPDSPRDTHAFHNKFQKRNPDWKGD
jgi:hypothetical protein